MKPKISIITPSYNQSQFLEDTILSVLGQQYDNLEYFIIDGGSTDKSVDIIKRYEHQLDYWVSEKDNGQADAINKGFSKASGDILMWLNSDDLLMPNILNYIASIATFDNPFIWFGNCIHFQYSNKLLTSGSDVVGNFRNQQLEQGDFIIQPSSFWNRKALEKTGLLNEKYHYVLDWEWFLRAKHNKVKFIPLEKCISMYRIHEAHKSSTGGKIRQNEIAGIYAIYNNRFEKLYRLLMTERISATNPFSRFISFAARILFKKRAGKDILLKVIKPQKYSAFTSKEIQQANNML